VGIEFINGRIRPLDFISVARRCGEGCQQDGALRDDDGQTVVRKEFLGLQCRVSKLAHITQIIQGNGINRLNSQVLQGSQIDQEGHRPNSRREVMDAIEEAIR